MWVKFHFIPISFPSLAPHEYFHVTILIVSSLHAHPTCRVLSLSISRPLCPPIVSASLLRRQPASAPNHRHRGRYPLFVGYWCGARGPRPLTRIASVLRDWRVGPS